MRINILLLCVGAVFPSLQVFSQSEKSAETGPYRIDVPVDVSLTALAATWTIYGFSQTSKHNGITLQTLNSLKKSNVNGFDRWGIKAYSSSANTISYWPFYAATVYPIIFAAVDKRMRSDFLKIGFMYLETMSITGALYSSATHYAQRFRPLVYDQKSPLAERLSPNSRKSFFAGHVALVGTSAFFMAEVFSQYHPDSRYKWLVYGSAGTVTALTAFLRMEAGKHFFSDVLTGGAVGTLTGIFTPRFHRYKIFRSGKLSVSPFSGVGNGILLRYKL